MEETLHLEFLEIHSIQLHTVVAVADIHTEQEIMETLDQWVLGITTLMVEVLAVAEELVETGSMVQQEAAEELVELDKMQ
jgi:hypothetical protein